MGLQNKRIVWPIRFEVKGMRILLGMALLIGSSGFAFGQAATPAPAPAPQPAPTAPPANAPAVPAGPVGDQHRHHHQDASADRVVVEADRVEQWSRHQHRQDSELPDRRYVAKDDERADHTHATTAP